VLKKSEIAAIAACLFFASFLSEAHAGKITSIGRALAGEKIITAENPEEILSIAKGFGSAVLGKDSEGDPKISGRIDGIKYWIYFYGCVKGKDCDDVQFSTAWSDVKVTMADINEWNRTMKYGMAYLDEDGDPTLELMVNIDYGVTVKNFDDTFDWWAKVMKLFKKDVIDKQN